MASAAKAFWRGLSQKDQVRLGTAMGLTFCALPFLNKTVWETEQKMAQLRDMDYDDRDMATAKADFKDGARNARLQGPKRATAEST